MKRFGLTFAAVFSLGLGFGTSVSASDPDCYSTCQELMNDCLAQTSNFRVCARAYRDCLASCEL
jgi:hypothetical protein